MKLALISYIGDFGAAASYILKTLGSACGGAMADNVDITSDVSEYASAREKIGIDVNSITHVKNKTIDFPTTCISLFTQRHPTEFYFNNNSITIYL